MKTKISPVPPCVFPCCEAVDDSPISSSKSMSDFDPPRDFGTSSFEICKGPAWRDMSRVEHNGHVVTLIEEQTFTNQIHNEILFLIE